LDSGKDDITESINKCEDINNSTNQYVTHLIEDKDTNMQEHIERYRAIFNNSLDGIILDFIDGTILSANPPACRMFGRSEEEICALGRNEIVDLNDPRFLEAVQEREKTGSFYCEMTLVRKDGSKFPAEVTSKLFKDTKGRILSSTIIRDITERKQAEALRCSEEKFSKAFDNSQAIMTKKVEEALRLSQELFYKAFDANPLAMYIVSMKNGTIVEVNETVKNRSKRSREVLIGENIINSGIWVEPSKRDKYIELIRKKGLVENLEINFPKKSGGFGTVLLSGVLISWQGEECVLSITNDVTELRRYQYKMERLDRLNLIGEIAASIAHEIRNPLTTVRGFLQLLGLEDRHTEDKEYMDLMIEELDRANSIITEFLSLSKNKALYLKQGNLNPKLVTLLPLLQADAVKNNILIKLELEDIPNIMFDEDDIRQLVLNLVRNGLDAMPAGGELAIKTFIGLNEVTLAIQDHGSGIPSEIMENIGTPFFTTKDNGTGLGLTVCYRIAQRHNARIEIETGLEGTVFKVIFSQMDCLDVTY
jgi:PAS domain S-box-containing protein